MTKQRQTVGDASVAVQAQGPVTVNQGLTSAQIADIITALGEKIGAYEQRAKEVVDQRLNEFKEVVLKEFAAKGEANPEAFSDPDFQYIFGKTQQAYVRSSDDEISQALVSMIAERSKHTARDRIALAMNSAIETSASLTREEFAELSLIFLMRRVKINSVDCDKIFHHFDSVVKPFIDGCSTEDPSYDYLVAQNCATHDIGRSNIPDLLRITYGGAFAKGATLDEIQQIAPAPQSDRPITIYPIPESDGLYRLAYVNIEELDNAQKGAPNYEAVKSFYEGSIPDAGEVVTAFRKSLNWFGSLEALWESTPIGQLNPTSKGIVIAHSNIKRTIEDFSAPLSIWVR